MQFIQGKNRNQAFFSTLDDQVMADNVMRLSLSLINKLDQKKLAIITITNMFLISGLLC